ncbi:MAG: hypothetical protein JNL74_05195 [Fibrobacteres bacterium]|nr:hypothetical protein [Fibrobacterota bacterium]
MRSKLIILPLFAAFAFLGINAVYNLDRVNLQPWEAIGGCGAGGSGGAGGGAAKWIGKGVTGGLLNLQTMASYTWGENFSFFTFHNRFSAKPTWSTDVGLGIPLVSKSAIFQFQSNVKGDPEITGGLGDITLDVSKTFGGSGQYSLTFSTSMPTGQYNIKRDGLYLPGNLQKGTGLWAPSLSFSYSKDFDRAMLLADFAYSHPIAMRLFSGENEFLSDPESGFEAYKDSTENSRFYYRFKPYGESDLGDYAPPSLTMAAYYAYKGNERRMQSIGLSFSMPLGEAWIHSPRVGEYNPIPDPDFKKWTLSVLYGYEFSHEEFPVYFAVNLPITPKSGTAWSGPEFGKIFQTGTVYLGFKSTFF